MPLTPDPRRLGGARSCPAPARRWPSSTGRAVPAASGETVAGPDARAMARCSPRSPPAASRTWTARCEPARAAFDDGRWSDLHPADRKRLLLRFAELVRGDLANLALLEALDGGKPIADTLRVDAPKCAESAAVVRRGGRQAVRRGRAHRPGSALAGDARAGGRGGGHRALELPAHHQLVEAGSGAGGGQHGHPQAGLADAA